jgi:hypothetical protein
MSAFSMSPVCLRDARLLSWLASRKMTQAEQAILSISHSFLSLPTPQLTPGL